MKFFARSNSHPKHSRCMHHLCVLDASTLHSLLGHCFVSHAQTERTRLSLRQTLTWLVLVSCTGTETQPANEQSHPTPQELHARASESGGCGLQNFLVCTIKKYTESKQNQIVILTHFAFSPISNKVKFISRLYTKLLSENCHQADIHRVKEQWFVSLDNYKDTKGIFFLQIVYNMICCCRKEPYLSSSSIGLFQNCIEPHNRKATKQFT